MFSRILAAIDLNHESSLPSATLKATVGIAQLQKTQVRLVHVRFMIEQALRYLSDDALAKEEQVAIEDLMELGKRAGLDTSRLSAASPMGDIYDHVLTAAADFNADLIIMGPHSPSMAKYLLGGNAAKIVRHAPISVLIAR